MSIFMANYQDGKCGTWGLSPLPRLPAKLSDGFQQASLLSMSSCVAKMEKGLRKVQD